MASGARLPPALWITRDADKAAAEAWIIDSLMSFNPEYAPPSTIPSRLVRVMEKGSVWQYPQGLSETSSISANSAVPVTGRWPTDSTTRSKHSSFTEPAAST